jgi:hypothetical protein
MLSIELGSETVLNLLQSSKTRCPISVTELGIETDVNLLQP